MKTVPCENSFKTPRRHRNPVRTVGGPLKAGLRHSWITIISALVTVPNLAPLPQNSSCLNSWPTSDGGFCGSLACAIRRPLRKSFRAKPLFSAFSIRSTSAAFLSVIAKGRLGDREANFEDIPACPSVFSFVSDEYSGDQSGTWILGC